MIRKTLLTLIVAVTSVTAVSLGATLVGQAATEPTPLTRAEALSIKLAAVTGKAAALETAAASLHAETAALQPEAAALVAALRPAKEETPPPPPPPPSSGMAVGLDTGGWTGEPAINDAAGAAKFFRSNARNYSDDTHIGRLAKAGVTLAPLLEDNGNGSPPLDPSSEALTWCSRYCKGGTYWAGKPVDLGATTLEIVNEPDNPYFWCTARKPNPCGEGARYAAIVEHVAATLKSGLPSGQPQPRLLVSYDGGYEGDSFGRALVKADPGLLNLNIGWTVHPYGGTGSREQSALGGRSRVTEAHSDTGGLVYVTEVGWPTCGQTGDSLSWSESEQAANITRWVGWTRSLVYVPLTVNFNYADYAGHCYGVVNSSATTHKLSYSALKG